MRTALLTLLLVLGCASAQASVEINQADEAQLDSVKGIGPALSSRMLDERRKAPFRDWADLIARVKGMGPVAASRLSREGLTVNGVGFRGTAPAQAERAQPAASAAGNP